MTTGVPADNPPEIKVVMPAEAKGAPGLGTRAFLRIEGSPPRQSLGKLASPFV